MACTGLIDADILFDCEDASIAGLEVDTIIVNRADVDTTSITYDASNKLLMTNFQLKAGKSGFLIKGVKQVNSTNHELVIKETGTDKVKHIFNGLILTPSAANKLQLQNMKDGGDFVLIVEKKWKGASDEDAFEVYGIDSGLKLTASNYNSNENDGAITFSLTSEDGYEEPKYPCNLLETDYDTTKTAFGNKFVQA
tara:strand:- start:749 stop:1336 length:588 start_codon:yes stop_codon:yes gene_type:complete